MLFDAVGWAAGRASGLQKLSAVMVICLERDADLHMAQLMPLPLTVSFFSKSRLVLPFWYRLTRVILDKGLLSGGGCFILTDRFRFPSISTLIVIKQTCFIMADSGQHETFTVLR